MPLTWIEDNSSRSATIHRLGKKAESTMSRSYKVFGTTDDAVLHAEANATITGSLAFWQYPGANVQLMAESYSVEYLGDDAWHVTINYSKDGADGDEPDPLRRSRSFDTSGGTLHITQCQAVGAGANLDFEKRFPPEATNMSGAIGVDGSNVNGVDIIVPALSWTETYDVPSQFVTSAYIKSVAGLTGTVNNAAFRSFAKGEVLFTGASGSQDWDSQKGNGPWSLSYKFTASPNAGAGQTMPAITIGNINNIEKGGHEYLWVRYEPKVDQTALIQHPKAVYVNKVYREADFSGLGIGTT